MQPDLGSAFIIAGISVIKNDNVIEGIVILGIAVLFVVLAIRKVIKIGKDIKKQEDPEN